MTIPSARNATTAGPSDSDTRVADDVRPAPVLRVERHFLASPARVFQAWTTAEELSQWSNPQPTPLTVQLDFRVGGRYAFGMAGPDGTVHRVTGVYREIDAPRRLVYTWRWETMGNFPETLVTVEFREGPNGGTDLLLVHEGLPDDASGQRHQKAWITSMEKLARLLG